VCADPAPLAAECPGDAVLVGDTLDVDTGRPRAGSDEDGLSDPESNVE